MTDNYDSIPRRRTVSDLDLPIPPRDPGHELAPLVEPTQKSGGQMMIEATIGHVDKATEFALETLDKLEAEIKRVREVILKSKVEVHDVLRSHMIIAETAMNSTNQIAQQLFEATKGLVVRNGK